MITGIVVKNMNGYFYVQDDTGTIHECKVRGRLKQVVLVVAAHEPDINELLLNKMLVMIEHADIPIVLCINKCDLMDSETKAMVDLYKSIGYEVLMTSTYNMTGIDDLRHVLQHKVTAFAGPSGVGKSSLLNAVDPKFAFQTGEVSDKIKRGKHTTRHASLYSLDADSFIMDTPGFSAIEFNDVSLERGHIHQGRYDAYMSIRNDIESQRKRF
ncbi:MAG: ribosome small subunit-dependent GTPase A [Veillonella sp.]|nr:ribosome small subunit-dependent GTPase A [Veillonella sp.]